MEVLVILAVMATGLFAGAIYNAREGKRRFRMPPKTGLLGEYASSERVGDHAVTHERVYAGERRVETITGSAAVEYFQNRTTVFGLLPEWIAFGWVVNDRVRLEPPDDHNELWVEVLFGRIKTLPVGGTLFASGGDLVYETRVARDPPTSRGVLAIARAYLKQGVDPVVALAEYTMSRPPPTNTIAFRLLSRNALEAALKIADDKRDTDDEPLAAAIAAYEYPASRERLATLAASEDALARRLAWAALIEHADIETLLELGAKADVPDDLSRDFIEVLRKFKRPGAEAIIIGLLEGPARGAAVDALAVVGSRTSVEVLRGMGSQRDLDDETKVGIEVALELIRARIEEGPGARGGLALAESEDRGGAVSVASDGALALTEED